MCRLPRMELWTWRSCINGNVGTPLMTELTNISKINELYWMADDKLNFEKEKVLRHSKLDDVLDQAMQVMQTLQDEDFRTSIETLAKTIPVA